MHKYHGFYFLASFIFILYTLYFIKYLLYFSLFLSPYFKDTALQKLSLSSVIKYKSSNVDNVEASWAFEQTTDRLVKFKFILCLHY